MSKEQYEYLYHSAFNYAKPHCQMSHAMGFAQYYCSMPVVNDRPALSVEFNRWKQLTFGASWVEIKEPNESRAD